MPKQPVLINNLNSGELSPKLDFRTDITKYQAGCRTLQNMVPLVEGGAARVPGTKFVTPLHDESRVARLVPFHFSTTQAYILEFGHNYIRVFKDSGIVSASDKTISGVTKASPGVVTATSHGFSNGDKVIITGVVGMVQLNNRVFTVANKATHTFELSGVNTTSYTTYVSGGTASKPVVVTTTYTESEIPNLDFAQSADTLYIVHPAHAPATLTRASDTSWTLSTITFKPPPASEGLTDLNTPLTPGATTGTNILFTAVADVFLASDVDREIVLGESIGPTAVIITVDTPKTVHANIRVDFASTDQIAAGGWFLNGSPVAKLNPNQKKKTANVTLTLNKASWRSQDVGKYVFVHDGSVKITSISTTTIAIGEVISELSSYKQTEQWTLESSTNTWSATRGWPSCVTFFEDRLTFANNGGQPHTVWASRMGDYYNFTKSTLDDDAYEFTLNMGMMDAIHRLAPHDYLMPGTASGVWKLGATNQNEPLTQTNVTSRKQSNQGVLSIPPVILDGTIWVSRSGRKLIKVAYQLENDRYMDIDMTKLASHITLGSTLALSGIKWLAFQQEPVPILWAIRTDGQLLGMTYEVKENVFAWFRVVTDGLFESVAVISKDNTEDQVWVIVKRTVNTETRRYVEYFMPHEFFGVIADNFFVHSGLTYNSTPTSTISGLFHLEGKTIDVLGDGLAQTQKTVSGGAITLATAASKVHVGLSCPAIVEPMKVVSENNRGQKQKVNRLTTCFYQTGYGVKAGSDSSNLKTILGMTVGVLNTVDVPFEFPGDWKDAATLYIKQEKPLPMTVLALIPRLNVNYED